MTTNVRQQVCLVVLVIAAGACAGCTRKTSAAPEEIPVVPAARAVRMEMRNDVTLTAELEPYYEVDVMAKEAGYIRHVLVDIGDHVKAGQLLCVLETWSCRTIYSALRRMFKPRLRSRPRDRTR